MTCGNLGQRRFTVLVLAVFCAAGMHQGGAAQVLCIGEDGHVEVESPGFDCCASVEQSEPRGVPQFDASDESHTDHCGSCIDFPIVTSSRVVAQHVSIDRPDASATVDYAVGATDQPHVSVGRLGHAFCPELTFHTAATLPLLI